MSDHHRFTRDLIWLRRRHPALRGEGINVFHVHNDNRVIAFHRWLPGVGRDVVVVASLNESAFHARSYRIGFPMGGHWNEVQQRRIRPVGQPERTWQFRRGNS
jgi:1,4-alpha-glucan branching enzyme